MVRHSKHKRDLSPLLESGFHGDRYLQSVCQELLRLSDVFVETGCNVGSTARYVAAEHPKLSVHSCEPSKEACKAARNHTKHLHNVSISNELSPDFLYNKWNALPEIRNQTAFVFLDAHGYGYRWPLADELRFLFKEQPRCVILIDDFHVPGREEFNYSAYDDQKCDLDYVREAIARFETGRFFIPDYSERTSPHHALTGHVFITLGHAPFDKTLVACPHYKEIGLQGE